MRTQLTQAQGGTLRTATLMAIARSSNCKISEVAYLDAGAAIDGIKFLFDKDSETVWVNEGTGTVVSWTLSGDVMTVVTNTGTYALNKEVDGTTGSIKWIYNGGYAKGGETTVTIDADSALSVTEAYLNGGRQFEGQGYTVSGLTVTLASPLAQNDLLVIILGSETLDSADALQSVLAGSGGAGQIGLAQGGTVQESNYIVTPQMASNNATGDIGDAISKAILIAQETGRTVEIPGGDYNQLTSVDVTLTTPLSIRFNAGVVIHVKRPITSFKINVNSFHLSIEGNQASFFSDWGDLKSSSPVFLMQIIDNSLDKSCSVSDIKLGYVGNSKFDYSFYLQSVNLGTFYRNILQSKSGIYLESSLNNGDTAHAMGCQFVGNEIYSEDIAIKISNQGKYGCEGLLIADGEYVSDNNGIIISNDGLSNSSYLPPLLRIRGNHFNTYTSIYVKDVSRVMISNNDFQSRHSDSVSVLGAINLGGVQGFSLIGNSFTSVATGTATDTDIAPPIYQFGSSLTNAFFTVLGNTFWLNGLSKGAMSFNSTTNVAVISYVNNTLESNSTIVDNEYRLFVRISNDIELGNFNAGDGISFSTDGSFSNNNLTLNSSPARGTFYQIASSAVPDSSTINNIEFPSYMVGNLVSIKFSSSEISFIHGVSLLCPDSKSFKMMSPNTIQVFVFNTSQCVILTVGGVNTNQSIVTSAPTSRKSPGSTGDEFFDQTTLKLYKYINGYGWVFLQMSDLS